MRRASRFTGALKSGAARRARATPFRTRLATHRASSVTVHGPGPLLVSPAARAPLDLLISARPLGGKGPTHAWTLDRFIVSNNGTGTQPRVPHVSNTLESVTDRPLTLDQRLEVGRGAQHEGHAVQDEVGHPAREQRDRPRAGPSVARLVAHDEPDEADGAPKRDHDRNHPHGNRKGDLRALPRRHGAEFEYATEKKALRPGRVFFFCTVNQPHRSARMNTSLPDAPHPPRTPRVPVRVLRLRQASFATGLVVVSAPDTLVLFDEDVVVDFGAPAVLESPLHHLGHFAALVIGASRVIVDLRGHSLSMSPAFARRQRFFALIALNVTPFPAGTGRFTTAPVRPEDVAVRRGTLGLTSHFGIHSATGGRRLRLEALAFRDFEVSTVALSAWTEFRSSTCRSGCPRPRSRAGEG